MQTIEKTSHLTRVIVLYRVACRADVEKPLRLKQPFVDGDEQGP